MSNFVPADDLPDNLVPADDLPEDPASTGKKVNLGNAVTRGIERGAWAIPAMLTGGALSAENFEAGKKYVEAKLRGENPDFSALQENERELSRAGEQQHPWATGISRGVGQGPGEALLTIATGGGNVARGVMNEAASPVAQFLALRAKDATLKARQIANAVTQAGRQFGVGTSTSVAPTVAGQIAEGVGSAAVAAPLGALSPAPVASLEPELSYFASKAGKQAVKAHRATDTDIGNLQNKHGAGSVGDEAIAGLKVLNLKTPDGEPVLPYLGSPEKLAKNWEAVSAASGKAKGEAVAAVDEARPAGAVDWGKVIARAYSKAVPETRTPDIRVNYGTAPEEDALAYIQGLMREYGTGKGSLSDLEQYKSTTQRYVNETGSQKNPVRPRQAIDNDPALRTRRTISGIAKKEGEDVADEVLGPDAGAKFRADKEAYGLAEDFERYAHNAYNRSQGRIESPRVAHKWDLIRRLEDTAARTNAMRAHAYNAIDKGGAADVAGDITTPIPVSVAARSVPSTLQEYLRARGVIE